MDHRLPMTCAILMAALISFVDDGSAAAQSLPSILKAPVPQDRFTDATRLVETGDYARAVSAIEEEITRAPLLPEENMIYDLLALAAFKANMNDKALAASIMAIANDPASPAWNVVSQLHASAKPWQESDLPPQLRRDSQFLLPVLRCGVPTEWPAFGMRGCVSAYIAYATQAAIDGQSQRSRVVREVAAAVALDQAQKAYFDLHDMDQAEALIGLAGAATDLENTSPEIEAQAFSLLVFIDEHKQRYLHAVSDYEHLFKSGNGFLVPQMRKTMERFLMEVYDSISWDPQTGMLRVADPDDFFDNVIPIDAPRREKGLPYGMTSRDEDSATLVTALFADEARKLKIAGQEHMQLEPIDTTIDRRLKAKNFELPVKILVQRISFPVSEGNPVQPAAAASIDQLIERIEKAMRDADDIPDPTLVAFEVAKRAWALRVRP